jgi:hypothetical protein
MLRRVMRAAASAPVRRATCIAVALVCACLSAAPAAARAPAPATVAKAAPFIDRQGHMLLLNGARAKTPSASQRVCAQCR